jgi:hypothetical protein
MEFWLPGSLSHELFSFFTMEFRLLGSLSHELFSFFHDGILAIKEPFPRTFLFSRWNSGYQEAFLTNFFLFHDGILSIRKPFSQTSFFFHDGILAIRKPFSRTSFFFHDGILEIRSLGEDSFHIYMTKSIYIGSASLKTLPLDLEPPLQGKEYGPPYSNATKKRKANVFSRITYRHVIRIFYFSECKFAKIEKIL